MNSIDQIQQIQTAYRRRILDCWDIPPGSRILEIGCGQGEMTSALAEAVGPTGHVIAVDIAGRDYGTPLTLGEATDQLKAGEFGDRIDFRFEYDITASEPDQLYDYAVMVHCSWYFESSDKLRNTLSALTKHAKHLCFAEWDTVPRSQDQIPHLLAILIQGQVEALKTSSQSNVRTPFTVSQIKRLLSESGWTFTKGSYPSTEGLQDSDWEIDECCANSLHQAAALNLSARHQTLLEGQIDLLRQLALPSGNVPLSSVSFVAERQERVKHTNLYRGC